MDFEDNILHLLYYLFFLRCVWLRWCEVVLIFVTTLRPIVLFPPTGALSLGETTASFCHRYIFLYIGGFLLTVVS